MSKKKKCIGTREIAKAASVEDMASYVLSLPKDYDFTKLPQIDSGAWSLIVSARPDLAAYCDFSKFTASDWIVLLSRQPGMAAGLHWQKVTSDEARIAEFVDKLDEIKEAHDATMDEALSDMDEPFFGFLANNGVSTYSIRGLPRFTSKKSGCAGMKWQYVLKDGNAIITGLIDKGEKRCDHCDYFIEELHIPSRIDGYRVTTMAESAFTCFYKLRKVVVANGVKEIGPCAFSHCNNLESVVLPVSIKAIRPQAFSRCALRSITIPVKCEYVGYNAFDNNPLEEVDIPPSVIELDDYAFESCKSLKRFVIRNKHCKIGDGVLKRCPELRQVFTPFKKHYLKPNPHRTDSDLMFRALMCEDMTYEVMPCQI